MTAEDTLLTVQNNATLAYPHVLIWMSQDDYLEIIAALRLRIKCDKRREEHFKGLNHEVE